MFRIIFTVFFLITIYLFTSCIQQTAQLPSNKGNNNDSIAKTLLSKNNEIAEEEDSLIKKYVAKQKEQYIKHPIGFWYFNKNRTEQDSFNDKKSYTIDYIAYTLDNVEVESKRQIIFLGKKQTMTGIEESIKVMETGDSIVLILPSYLAYGRKGNGEKIRPFTTLKVKVHLLR